MMMYKRNFAVFILSHGRPQNVITLKTLKKQGYKGKYYIICDNEDDTIVEYIRIYGKNNVVIFNKKEIAEKIDEGDNFNDRRVILYARVACFEIAKKLGITHFLQLDDDYESFGYKIVNGGKLKTKKVDIQKVIELYLDFLDKTNSLTIAFGQGGDLIGGANNPKMKNPIGRKAMNSFFCKTENPIPFVGRINEDVNMYTTCNIRGEKIFSFFKVSLIQKQTQSQKGGMTEIYLDNGTYIKAFYSVMYAPSCVKVSVMGDTHKRIHHEVKWDKCAPKILQEYYKKKG